MDNLWPVILFTVVMTLTPGPNNIMILSSGLNFGVRASVPHLLGIALGFPVMLLAVGLGLDTLISNVPILQSIIQVLGVSYLLFLAYRIFTTTEQRKIAHQSKPLTFFQAALFQWVNPKAWVLIFSGIGSFAQGGEIVATTLAMTLSFLLVMVPCNGLWLLLGIQMQRFVNNPKRLQRFNQVMAVLLVVSVVPVVF